MVIHRRITVPSSRGQPLELAGQLTGEMAYRAADLDAVRTETGLRNDARHDANHARGRRGCHCLFIRPISYVIKYRTV